MSTLFTDFFDASQARNIAMGGASALGVVLTEISYIKAQIDTAASGGNLSVTIINATTMTSSTAYYNAWSDPVAYADDASVLYRARMDAVLRYFSALGYRVQRQRENTQNRFEWIISW